MGTKTTLVYIYICIVLFEIAHFGTCICLACKKARYSSIFVFVWCASFQAEHVFLIRIFWEQTTKTSMESFSEIMFLLEASTIETFQSQGPQGYMYRVRTGPQYHNRHFRMIQMIETFKHVWDVLVATLTKLFLAPSPDFGSQKRMPLKIHLYLVGVSTDRRNANGWKRPVSRRG